MLDLLFISIWPNSWCFICQCWHEEYIVTVKKIPIVTCFVPVLKNQWAKTCKLLSCTLQFAPTSCPKRVFPRMSQTVILCLDKSVHCFTWWIHVTAQTLHIQNRSKAHVQVFLPAECTYTVVNRKKWLHVILFFLSHYINIINLPEYLIFESMLYMRDKVYSNIWKYI